MNAAVVICCYTAQRLPDIIAAVESAHSQRPEPHVMVVVDHNPELFRLLSDHLTTSTVIENEHERGLSGARNTGLEHCIEDVVAFLDDDAIADPGWLAALMAEYQDPAVIAVGGYIEPAWDDARPAWFPPEFGWVIGCSYAGQPTERAIVRNVIGANMSFRQSSAALAGGFGGELGRVGANTAGCEETEYCLRAARITGGHVVYQPDARVRHRVPRDRGRLRYFLRRCYSEGRSKAVVARLAGADAALSTERGYVLNVLGKAVLSGLFETVRRFSSTPLRRAGAIVLGFSATASGYASGCVSEWARRSQRVEAPMPAVR